MAKVIVYSQPTCAPCHAEKAWLREHGIEFEDRNIRQRSEWLDELVALGSQSTPTTVIDSDDGRQVVIGYNRGRLTQALRNQDTGHGHPQGSADLRAARPGER